MTMESRILSKRDVQRILNRSFGQGTSLDELWTPDNPQSGHCAVASAVAQDYRGGFIRGLFLPRGLVGRLGFCSHYVLVVGGRVEDYTSRQFPTGFRRRDFVNGWIGRNTGNEDQREAVLAIEEILERYKLLKERFDQNFLRAREEGWLDLLTGIGR